MTRAPLRRRAFLGVDLERGADGALCVVEVTPGEAGERGGVRVGDVLRAVNGVSVDGVLHANALVGASGAGARVRLSLVRDGQPLTLEVVLGEMPLEVLSSGRVELDQVEWRGHRLRAVWTLPEGPGPFPAVWLLPGATWLAEEQPLREWYPTRKLVDELTRAGFAALRVERSGLGDSEGPECTELDLDAELEAFRAARACFFRSPFAKPGARFLYGRSLGGMLAPLLSLGQPFTKVAVWGTSASPWHETMLAASRSQYELLGLRSERIDGILARLAELQRLIYVEGLSPAEAYRARPDLSDVQPESFSGELVYGRTYRYFHQLQHANVADAWRRVSCPVLALRGTCDYLSSSLEHRRLVELAPHGVAREVPGLDHHMHERSDLAEALREPWGGSFHPAAANALLEFFESA